MRIEFAKIHGCKNHFVVCFDNPKLDWSELSRKLCAQAVGVWADGVMLVSEAAPFVTRMFNPDGTQSEMCGNGVRCVLRFLVMKSLIKDEGSLDLRFGKRLLRCEYSDAGRKVCVNMGAPVFDAQLIPVKYDGDLKNVELRAAGQSFRGCVLSMSNPHCVIFLPSIKEIDRSVFGPLLENNPIFPERANISFAERIDKGRIRSIVWERGAGATLASGSSSCAVAVAGVICGRTERKVTVEVPGGELYIEWRLEDNNVYLSGPAEEVFEGVFIWNAQQRH